MAKTYSLIQAQTLTSTASSVTFSNIPQNFTDLRLVISSRSNRAAIQDTFSVVFNDSASGYSYRRLYGDGTTAASDSDSGNANLTTGYTQGGNGTANVFGSLELYIPNYTSSVNKSVSSEGTSENNATGSSISMVASLWSNAAAITSVKLTPATGATLQIGSTFYLYGIGAHRASGGTITSDANFTYHTFTSSGTFTALEKINGAEVLMVAGGGSGGCNSAAGGGAGGVVNGRIPTLIAGTSYSAIVGAGGASVSTFEVKGNNGTGSNFGSLTTAVGGGAGGARTGADNASINNGNAGGSGGGGAGNAPTPGSGGAGTSGQGNAGGSGFNSASTFPGGGGGGAGAIGGTATASNGGAGGDGTGIYTSWHYATNTGVTSNGTNYIAGGGGGAAAWNSGSATAGTGGAGGGGAGALKDSSAGVAGTANTGSGGGGGSNSNTASSNVSGTGGSGLVIIRYPNVE